MILVMNMVSIVFFFFSDSLLVVVATHQSKDDWRVEL